MEEEEAGVRRWLVDITRVAPSPQLSSTPQPHSFIRTSAPRHHQVTTLLLLLLPYTTGHPPSHDFPIAGDRAAEGAAQSSPSPHSRDTHACGLCLDIVSISKPQGETTTKFISNFSSYLTDHEWNCIIRAGTPSEVLTEFYRYITSFRDIYRYGIYI
jgi:4'-phosphopantetheinyl transferase